MLFAGSQLRPFIHFGCPRAWGLIATRFPTCFLEQNHVLRKIGPIHALLRRQDGLVKVSCDACIIAGALLFSIGLRHKGVEEPRSRRPTTTHLKVRHMNDTDEFEIPIHSGDSLAILRLCMHELGHYLVGRKLGAVPSNVTVMFAGASKFQGISAASVRRDLVTVDDIRTYLEDRVCILMAGTLGEHLSIDPDTGDVFDRQRWRHEAATAYDREPSSASDKNKGEELLRTLLFIEGADTDDEPELERRMQAISNRIWEKAVDLLARDAGAFLSVAQEMAARVKFMGVKETFASEEIELWFASTETKPHAAAASGPQPELSPPNGDATAS